jgi:hypothetical protein
MAESKYWRVRINFRPTHEELSHEAWNRNEVGIWYGAWHAKELEPALKSRDALERLSRANRRAGLDWEISSTFLNLAKRFVGIESRDWVIAYFENSLHLAHVCSELRSSRSHPLNRKGEIFKFRKIRAKKSFSLDDLPDTFRLLSGVGRGNVFQPRGLGDLVALLGAASDEREVREQLRGKNLADFTELLGPASWESVCQAYLSLEHNFVPTGLRCGGTLPDLDIVGRRSTDGARIIAQCKKDPGPKPIADGFLKTLSGSRNNQKAFYFAFGGCSGEIPQHVTVIGRDEIAAWSKTKQGARYFKWLRGEQ